MADACCTIFVTNFEIVLADISIDTRVSFGVGSASICSTALGKSCAFGVIDTMGGIAIGIGD